MIFTVTDTLTNRQIDRQANKQIHCCKKPHPKQTRYIEISSNNQRYSKITLEFNLNNDYNLLPDGDLRRQITFSS